MNVNRNRDVVSSVNDIRITCTCKHCGTTFLNFDSKGLVEHLGEHKLQIHYKNIRVALN